MPATPWQTFQPHATFSPTTRLSGCAIAYAAEARDILIAGHFPYLPRLLALLVIGGEAGVLFPEHGIVALETLDAGRYVEGSVAD